MSDQTRSGRHELVVRMVDYNTDETTKSKGIDVVTGFLIEMLSKLEQTMEHEDMMPELAEILSTDQVRLLYEVTADIEIGGE